MKKLNGRRIAKIISSAIYVIGVICVLVLGNMYIHHSTYIPNPDAMLPMMEYEVAAWRIIVGTPFMIISCISVILTYRQKSKGKIAILLSPVMICLMILISFF